MVYKQSGIFRWCCPDIKELKHDHNTMNPDFSNLRGKRKLIREIEGGIKLRLIGRVSFNYEFVFKF